MDHSVGKQNGWSSKAREHWGEKSLASAHTAIKLLQQRQVGLKVVRNPDLGQQYQLLVASQDGALAGQGSMQLVQVCWVHN